MLRLGTEGFRFLSVMQCGLVVLAPGLGCMKCPCQ
jgi:hypothetical protein